MKYFIIEFGSTGATNLAVAVATTPTKYKGHRFNASAASHQLYSSVRRQGEDLTWGWVDQEKPFTSFPQDGVVQELSREDYITVAIERARKGCYHASGVPGWGHKIREEIKEELAEIEERQARDIKKNAI